MRHGIKTKKLNRTSSHRKALLKNLSLALLKHGQIKTTLPKAKLLRPYVEKLITAAKKPSLAVIRKLNGIISEGLIVKKLLNEIAPSSASRLGGYTRIYKMGFRYGDMAPMAVIELVDRVSTVDRKIDESKEKDKTKQDETLPKKTTANKAAPKATKVSKLDNAKSKSVPKSDIKVLNAKKSVSGR
jgi:large subunit ribosomal protein L17